MKVEIDSFSGYKIYPSKGRLFVRADSKVFRFSRSKTESLFLQRKNPRKIAWTQVYRRMHKKGLSEETTKRRTRRTVKHQGGIVGANIQKLLSQSAADREKLRKQAIAKAKADKKEKEAKKDKTKVRPNVPTAPKVSKQQMKGGRSGR
ncbi:60S ribosomal protein L24 [Fomitiporia mediterranea MF3/22]|uniref:60S ribosomal protein L24 n=1 Tax=Fomitiporia mediterranea (strain MF3/22) TaxID=694068 RepID=UPI00044082FA|nr:60S ribosomal protein L24 [Fomitiporia mediterranea MF3/22]EJD08456.1 60S ribosomal protein L24 [Fomitiporia mediterranea MF3/22]